MLRDKLKEAEAGREQAEKLQKKLEKQLAAMQAQLAKLHSSTDDSPAEKKTNKVQ